MKGTRVALNATPLCNGIKFERWNGTGTGRFTGTNIHGTVVMNSNITEYAVYYTTNTTLTINSCSNVIRAVYAKSTKLTLNTTPYCNGIPFGYWRGKGVGDYNGKNINGRIVMYSNITEVAYYNSPWTLNIHKGWNIVPFDNVFITSAQQNCHMSLASIANNSVVYSPQLNGYIPAEYVINEMNGTNYFDNNISDYTGWFNSSTNCKASFGGVGTGTRAGGIDKNNTLAVPTNLWKGWNFFTVQPWMVNQSYSNIFNNCTILDVVGLTNSNGGKSAAWGVGVPTVSVLVGHFKATKEDIGRSMVLKTASDCVLYGAGNSTAINLPSLP